MVGLQVVEAVNNMLTPEHIRNLVIACEEKLAKEEGMSKMTIVSGNAGKKSTGDDEEDDWDDE